LNILCPRCGQKSNITLEKNNDDQSYVLTCENCKTKIYIPYHPFLEMGIDLAESTIDTSKKFKSIYDILKVVLKKGKKRVK